MMARAWAASLKSASMISSTECPVGMRECGAQRANDHYAAPVRGLCAGALKKGVPAPIFNLFDRPRRVPGRPIPYEAGIWSSRTTTRFSACRATPPKTRSGAPIASWRANTIRTSARKATRKRACATSTKPTTCWATRRSGRPTTTWPPAWRPTADSSRRQAGTRASSSTTRAMARATSSSAISSRRCSAARRAAAPRSRISARAAKTTTPPSRSISKTRCAAPRATSACVPCSPTSTASRRCARAR
ncbi:Uncharacterised protein [Bordetella pertussis]|nr:Uncharacterised protein [Bordetella pertussis]CPK63898.1 Uncharacterised protein [Bordetella pertussis]CPO09629.1 Uncharacterised protein [Bordetella pertussis]